MADQGSVVITIRKDVPDRDTARVIYDMVKQKLADRPDVKLSGHFTNHFDLDGD